MNLNPDSGSPQVAQLSPPTERPGRFTYASGDRPLDGYTIKRGIGSGGFGEVYYAVSDGGKEVAMKLVQRHLDVELRGVSQCLNLKHPNLVALYDVKQSERGDYWVVMEHVTGETLAEVIEQRPQGLAADEVLGWLRGIADAVAYLHDHGIVHRDLKPGNIFIENRIVKIGDYGLAKYISASRRSGQTESVGTVHYMAPEIARGRYGKEIDQYAVGVIVYEMLTGRVPFDGESPGEILMKHLTAEPDMSVLPAPYRATVARLLAKDPESRYASMPAILDDLQTVLAGGSPAGPAPRAAVPPVPPPPGSRAAHVAEGARSRSVRFRIKDVHGGLSTAEGVLRFTGDSLVFEFQVKLLDMVSGGLKEVRVALAELEAISLSDGWFGSSLVIRAARSVTFADIPTNQLGQLTLRIKRHDREAAQSLVECVSAAMAAGNARAEYPAGPQFGTDPHAGGFAGHAAERQAAPRPDRLVRPFDDRIWAGVCSGIANYFEIDPFWIRATYLVGSIFTSFVPGIIVYLLLCFVIPNADASHGVRAGDAPIRRLRRPRAGRVWAGVCNAWAAYFGIDPVWVRLPYALVTFFTAIIPGLVSYFVMAWIIPEGELDAVTPMFAREPRGPGVFRRFFRVVPRLLVSLVVGGGVGLVTGGICDAWPAPVSLTATVLFALGVGFTAASLTFSLFCRRLDGPHRLWPALASLLLGGGAGVLAAGAAEWRGSPWNNEPASILIGLGSGFITAAFAAYTLFTSLGVALRWRWFFEVIFLGAGTALVSIALGFVLGTRDDVAIVLGIGAGLLTAGTLAYLLIFTRLAARLSPQVAFAGAAPAAAADLKQTHTYYEPKSGASRWMRNVVGANPAIGGLNVLLGIVAIVLLAAWAGLSHLATNGGGRGSRGGRVLVLPSSPPPVVEWEVHRLTGHSGRVSAVAFSPDGQHVATGGEDHSVRLWSLATDAEVNRFTGHTAAITSISFSADGARLAASADCRDVRVWDTTTGKEISKSFDHPGSVYSVALSPDGARLVTGSEDDVVRLIDASTGKQERQLLGSKRDVHAVAFSPDGTRIAAGSREHPGVVRVWDVTTGRPVQSFAGDFRLKTLAFSPDSRLLAAAGEHSSTTIWDIATGKHVGGPAGSTNWGGHLAFNPAGGQLIYAESYDSVALWDFDIRRVVCRFSTNRSTPTCLAFGADGSMVAAGRDDGAVRIWEVPEPARTTKLLPAKSAAASATDAATQDTKNEKSTADDAMDELKQSAGSGAGPTELLPEPDHG